MRASEIPGIDDLSTPERIMLVEDLWNSITADPARVPVPESHIAEIERRLEGLASQTGALLTFEELQDRIERRK